MSQNSFSTIGIIGGGKGGLSFLKTFLESDFVKVTYVADVNNNAPALKEAESHKIKTHNDLQNALNEKTDFILEATGREDVQTLINEKKYDETILITAKTALFISKIIEDKQKNNIVKSSSLIKEIIENITQIQEFLANINKIALNLKMLALNANIESARAGDHGKGFNVVADEVRNTADEASEMAVGIENINEKVMHLSRDLQQILKV